MRRNDLCWTSIATGFLGLMLAAKAFAAGGPIDGGGASAPGAASGSPTDASATGDAGIPRDWNSLRSGGNALTYRGVCEFEQDPNVPDTEKVNEWEAFIRRSMEQIAYAKKAAERWRNADRIRAVEAAESLDADRHAPTRDKMVLWQRVVELFPKSAEAATARKRIVALNDAETARLVSMAEDIERSSRGKLDRIRAWQAVATWAAKKPEARRAAARISVLSAHLFKEAESLHGIQRIDAATKLAAWRDVLEGAPSDQERRIAEERTRELLSRSREKQH